MGRTITTSNRYGVTLTDPNDSPVTIAGGVQLGGGQGQFGAGAFGLYGPDTVAWTVTNFGTVQGFVAGITLAAGGSVRNASGAQIFGSAYGIAISGAAAQVVNDGTVTGSQYYLKRDQIRTVTGYTGVGIGLTMGGSVVNGGKSSTATITGGRYGVRVTGGAGAVENSGTISAKSAYYVPPVLGGYNFHGFNGTGVGLAAGGSVVNHAGALVSGGAFGVSISGQAGLVVNAGSIIADTAVFTTYDYSFLVRGGTAVSLASGGSVTNTGIIAGYGRGVAASGASATVRNWGTISSKGSAFYGAAGGAVMNHAVIAGGNAGILIAGLPGLVVNSGTVTGASQYYSPFGGIYLSLGIHMLAGGRIDNGGSIAGLLYGVRIDGAAGTVANKGRISATYHYRPAPREAGVALTAGGSVANGLGGAGSAVIASNGTGVLVSGGPGVVRNAGTITGSVGVAFGSGVSAATLRNDGLIVGTAGTAVNFGTAAALLAIGAGAAFDGVVVASGTGDNRVELTNTGGTGAIGGLGSGLTGFGALALDHAAKWLLKGTNTAAGTFGIQLAAGAELQVTGSFAVSQVLAVRGAGELQVASGGSVVVGAGGGTAGALTIGAGSGGTAAGTLVGTGTISGAVIDNGRVIASGGKLAIDGALTGSGTVAISANAVLGAFGRIGVTGGVAFLAGGNSILQLGSPALATSVISGFGGSDKIDLLGTVATGITFSAATDILSVKVGGATIAALHFSSTYPGNSFQFAGDGHGGTNIFLV